MCIFSDAALIGRGEDDFTMSYFSFHRRRPTGLRGIGHRLLERGYDTLDWGGDRLHDAADLSHEYIDRGRDYLDDSRKVGRRYAKRGNRYANDLWSRRPWHKEPAGHPILYSSLGVLILGALLGGLLTWYFRQNRGNDNGGGNAPTQGPQPQGGMRMSGRSNGGKTVHASNPSSGSAESVHVGRGVVRRKQ